MSKQGAVHEVDVIASAIEALDGEGRVRKTLLLLPIGTFTLRDGRGPFTVENRAHAEAIVTASLSHASKQDMFVDYEHGLIHKAPKGEPNPAAGWFERLFADDEGVKADVDWTVPAQELLATRQYRYISPLFRAEQGTGRVTRLTNAGLVNSPAIDGLPAIAASLITSDQENTMKLTAIAASLDLGADATEAQIIAAAEDLKSRHAAATSALGLKAGANKDEIVAASTELGSRRALKDGEIVVPASAFDRLQKQVDELQGNDIAAAVREAVDGGRITPAEEEDLLEWGKSDPARVKRYLGKRTDKIVAAGEVIKGDPKPGAGKLSTDEIAAAELAGLSEEEFLAEKALSKKKES